MELFEPVAEAIVFSDDGFGLAKATVTRANSKAGLNNITTVQQGKRARSKQRVG